MLRKYQHSTETRDVVTGTDQSEELDLDTNINLGLNCSGFAMYDNV